MFAAIMSKILMAMKTRKMITIIKFFDGFTISILGLFVNALFDTWQKKCYNKLVK